MKKDIQDGMLVKSKRKSKHFGIGVVVNAGFTQETTQVYWTKLGKASWFYSGNLVFLQQDRREKRIKNEQ
jgi:hypothetical protein